MEASGRYLEAARQQLSLWGFLNRPKADEIIALQTYSSQHPDEPMITEIVMPRIRSGMALAHQHNQLLRDNLLRGQPVYWNAELAEVVHQGAPTFPTDRALRESDLPFPEGFIWFDEPLELPALHDTYLYTQAPRADWLRGFFWFSYDTGEEVRVGLPDMPVSMAKLRDRGVYIAFIVEDPDTRDGGIVQGVLPWTYGTTIDDMVNGKLANVGRLRSQERTTAKLQHAITALLFMQQPILRRSHLAVDRPARRLWEREAKVPAPEVQVIYLRRVHYEPTEVSSPRAVDWTCRWWVSPHWRTYNKGTVDEKQTFIWPYVKGPANAPLKAASAQVLAVVR